MSEPVAENVVSLPKSVDVHVGKQLRKRRKDLSLSQSALGDTLGVSFQQIQKYERGVNRIGSSRLYEISQALDVGITYFFEGIDDSDAVISDQETWAAEAFAANMQKLTTKQRRIIMSMMQALIQLNGEDDSKEHDSRHS